MHDELDRGSPSWTEWCDELDEQCTRTCRILRVWLTECVPSSLNGFIASRGTFWRDGMDGDGPSHRDRDHASMELHMFMELSCREEGRGQDKRWDWKRRSRHTSTSIQNLKLLRVEGIGGEVRGGCRFSLLLFYRLERTQRRGTRGGFARWERWVWREIGHEGVQERELKEEGRRQRSLETF